VWVGDVCAFVAEQSDEGFVLTGHVVLECGGDGISECEGRGLVEYGANIALGSYKATEGGWGVTACHDGFLWPMVVEGGDNVYVCLGHVTAVGWAGAYDL
jgi:hypothetical protein